MYQDDDVRTAGASQQSGESGSFSVASASITDGQSLGEAFFLWIQTGRLDKVLALSIFDRFKREELDLTEAL